MKMADKAKKIMSTVEADSTSHNVDGIPKKPPKTYENRKLSSTESNSQIDTSTSSPCSDSSAATTSSPQNTSRYGRARKPKITEDFYNTEDIFGPYDRLPCSPVRIPKKKPIPKLELSPNKSNEIVTLDAEIIKPNLDAMLSIDIPEDTIEVSKVMKIVSNNTSDEFSPKSPSFSKPVKTYAGKREKKNSGSIFESFGLPDYPVPYVNGLSHSENSDSSDSEVNVKKSLKLSDHFVNSNSDSDKIKRTKFNLLSLKKNTKSPVKPLIQSDNISTSTPENHKAIKSDRKSSKHLTKHKLKVSKIIKNKFRVQKKTIPISRLKAKKLKPHKKKSATKINLGKKMSEQHGSASDSNESQTDKKTCEAIDDLHKMYMPEVGDLTWSRVGTFPFWPSVVTKEPNSDRHSRTINFGKRITHFYHVNFFGDNGRRSWVLQTHIFPFHQRSDLEIMAKSVSKDAKPKEPRHLSAYIINPTKLVKWETAVTEAESLSVHPKEKRIKKFFEMVNARNKTSKSGKVSKPSKSKKKKTTKHFTEKSDTLNIKIKEEIKDDSYEDTDETYSRNRRKTKTRKPSIVSEDSFTDSEKLEPLIKYELRDTPSPVLSSSARHKKINLFKGITRERVCQICGKSKNVFKCKGQCNGQYHIECDRKQRLRLPAICDEKTDFETLIGENIVGKKTPEKIHIKEEIEYSYEVASSMVEQLLVNVFDSVSPERETPKLPSRLSIAEQIDLKMQEVMKNIVETNYNDSTTDYSSGSETESKTVSQNSEMSEIAISGRTDETPESKSTKMTKKVIKHVTADGVFDIIEETEAEEDYSNFKCTYCSTGYKPPCFICNKEKTKSGDVIKHKCMTTQCGKYYHAECLKDWPQTKWYLSTKRKEIDNENLSCPYHNCHTCISDDPRGPLSRMTHEKLAKCIRCPTTYHTKSYCIPAGTEILSNYQIICPKHLISPYVDQSEDSTNNKKTSKVKLMHHVNASWCFICSMGGSLICCETCPSSFHVECLKMTPPEGKYICEECESGRLPLYDEIVWVKLGSYRWWPAQILFPVEIPDNVKNIAHNKGEFVVRFFGSHDHYWVNRGRVFLFQEGDTGHSSSKKSAADRLFVKAIEEAAKAHQKFVGERENRVADSKNSMKPPSYIKIKVNKPVGDVRITDADTSNTTPCDCDPNWDHPCGPDSDCLNRILLTECNPMVCAASSRCCNQSFQNREYAHVEPFKTSARGWGLRTLSPVKEGTFVIEYVGEVINETEYRRRMKRKHEQKDENYYFLTIDKDRMIDAGPKGNVARFMNHSCSPNCETQKWTVNGDTRVGLFAIRDIPEGAELTFNYNLECIGEEKKECRCGAPNCSGFIGVKAKQDELLKKKKSLLKVKKTYKKKPQIQETKDFEVISCFVCGKPNAMQQCDREACNKFYHLECVSLESIQEVISGKWFCPWHSCNVCSKRTTRCCYMCINSYCPLHSEGSIRYDRVKGFICKEHDTPELNAINAEYNQELNKDIKKMNKKKYIKSKSSTPTATAKPKSIAEQDLEEILKHDVRKPIPLKPKSKSKSKKKQDKGDEKKKKKVVNERSLANLKQYRDFLRAKKLSRENENQEIKSENTNMKMAVTDKSSTEKDDTTKLPAAAKVEKTNGLHPDVANANKPPNQNNNLAIKKRKSRFSNENSDDSEGDDLPLSKRFKLDDHEIESITKPQENVTISTDDHEIANITKNMAKQEPSKTPKKSEDEAVKTSPKMLRVSPKNITKPQGKLEISKDNQEIANITKNMAKQETFKTPKKFENEETKMLRTRSSLDLVSPKNMTKPQEKLNISKDDQEIANITKNMAKQETVKTPKQSENEESKMLRTRSSLDLVSPKPKKEQQIAKPTSAALNPEKDTKPEEKPTNSAEVVVKRPRGRPRKYFPAPSTHENGKESSATSNDTEAEQKSNGETSETETTVSSLDFSKTDSQSQSSEFDSEFSTDYDDFIPQRSSQFVDLECDAEEGIQKSVIDKETLHVISINAEKPNNLIFERKTSEMKRMKLISPRPGTRKSLRITDPFDTSSNISNSEFEISIDLNSSQELNSSSVEEKRGRGRPKSSMKKKVLNVPVRKSTRFSNSDETKSQNETVTDLVKDSPTETVDTSSIKVEDISTTLDSTSSPALLPGEETLKRKRGRPRKYFNIAPIVVPEPPPPKRPKGRPRKVKPVEEPSSLNPSNVEETSELDQIKLDTESTTTTSTITTASLTTTTASSTTTTASSTTTSINTTATTTTTTTTTSSSKPKIPFETHINEIKLTTNVPERHLRVMLRKSEIESRAESKFLKMQNDIERDLPIRKRSKLRYETHL